MGGVGLVMVGGGAEGRWRGLGFRIGGKAGGSSLVSDSEVCSSHSSSPSLPTKGPGESPSLLLPLRAGVGWGLEREVGGMCSEGGVAGWVVVVLR